MVLKENSKANKGHFGGSLSELVPPLLAVNKGKKKQRVALRHLGGRGSDSYKGVAPNSRARVTQDEAFGSSYQGTILVHAYPQPHEGRVHSNVVPLWPSFEGSPPPIWIHATRFFIGWPSESRLICSWSSHTTPPRPQALAHVHKS